MQIFVLDERPQFCAQDYYDVHVNKILTEIVQMLCAGMWRTGLFNTGNTTKLPDGDKRVLYYWRGRRVFAPFKSGHANHPVFKWMWADAGNAAWSMHLAVSLYTEYAYRYSAHSHASGQVLLKLLDEPEVEAIYWAPFTYSFLHPISFYREMYAGAKRHLMRYTKRRTPMWLLQEINKQDQLRGLHATASA